LTIMTTVKASCWSWSHCLQIRCPTYSIMLFVLLSTASIPELPTGH